jgi:pilus assembly protein CpaE
VGNLINVLIVDDISSTLDNLRKLLAFEDDIKVVGTASNGREAVEQAKLLSPDIVLMDINMPGMDGIQAAEILANEAPASPVIIMSVQGERDYLRRAMQSVAREFLIKPFSGDELIASVRRVHQLEQRKEMYSRGATVATAAVASPVETTTLAPDSALEPAQAPASEAAVLVEDPVEVVALPQRRVYGELLVLYGGKGGVGKSVLACNLACALAKETGAKVALIDLDLQFGDIGVLLNVPQTQSISDVVDSIDSADADFLRDIMSEGPAGISVLPAATSPELADLVTPEHVQKIVGELRHMFDFVVVDTSSHLGDITLEALDLASRVILVTALSIPSVKNAKLALRLFETLAIPSSSITLVLNRCEAHTEFNKDSIESHLKFPVAVQLPHDPRTIVNSINRGVPFVVANPEVEASQKIRQLVAQLLPEKIGTETSSQKNRGLRFGRR